jgi:hypothetical protein
VATVMAAAVTQLRLTRVNDRTCGRYRVSGFQVGRVKTNQRA